MRMLDFGALDLIKCEEKLVGAVVVVMAANVSWFLRIGHDKEAAEAYHAALVTEQHEDGTPRLLQERKRGGDDSGSFGDYESQVRSLTFDEFVLQTPQGHEVRGYRRRSER